MIQDGIVKELVIGTDTAHVKVLDTQTNELVSFLIWSYFIDEPQIRHSNYLDLLRDALLNAKPVTIIDDPSGTRVATVRLRP
jgi:hypothetical protein